VVLKGTQSEFRSDQMTIRCESGAVLPLLYAVKAASQDCQPSIRLCIKVECLSVTYFQSAEGRCCSCFWSA